MRPSDFSTEKIISIYSKDQFRALCQKWLYGLSHVWPCCQSPKNINIASSLIPLKWLCVESGLKWHYEVQFYDWAQNSTHIRIDWYHADPGTCWMMNYWHSAISYFQCIFILLNLKVLEEQVQEKNKKRSEKITFQLSWNNDKCNTLRWPNNSNPWIHYEIWVTLGIIFPHMLKEYINFCLPTM